MAEVKIRLPRTLKQGEVVSARALVAHPMEVIARDKEGKMIDKVYNFIHTVTVTYNDKVIMSGEMSQSLSANPFIEFPLKLTAPGNVTVTFEDTVGAKHVGTAEVKF